MSIRDAFLDGARATAPLFASPALAARWTEPSALPDFSVAGLAGHLLRAVTVTNEVVTAPEPDGEPEVVTAFAAGATASWEANAAEIRQRGEAESAAGVADLARRYPEAVDRLDGLLTGAPPDRKVLRKQRVVALDDFLVIRAVELVVHADDLAVSLGVATPSFDETLLAAVIRVLVGSATERHGSLAVIVSLTRRERDAVEALRVV